MGLVPRKTKAGLAGEKWKEPKKVKVVSDIAMSRK